MELVCIKYPTVVAPRHEITAHGTQALETPGLKGRIISGLLASDSRCHSSVSGLQCGSPHRPFSKLHPGAAGAAAAHPLSRLSSTPGPWGCGGRYGGASRL